MNVSCEQDEPHPPQPRPPTHTIFSPDCGCSGQQKYLRDYSRHGAAPSPFLIHPHPPSCLSLSVLIYPHPHILSVLIHRLPPPCPWSSAPEYPPNSPSSCPPTVHSLSFFFIYPPVSHYCCTPVSTLIQSQIFVQHHMN